MRLLASQRSESGVGFALVGSTSDVTLGSADDVIGVEIVAADWF